jgi:hypothetical protein
VSLVERLRASARPLAVGVLALGGALLFTQRVQQGYPVRDWLFWPVALLWLYGLLLSASCVAFGAFVLRRLAPSAERPLLEKVVLSFVVGLVGFVVGLYAGGFLHLYGRAFGFALPILLLAIGAPAGKALAREVLEAIRVPASEPRAALLRAAFVVATLFGAYNVVLVYLEALTPESICFDAAWVHLTVPQDYARAGRIIPFFGEYAKNITELASLVWTWAFLVPVPNDTVRWMLALHLEFFVFLWTLAGVSAAVELLVGRRVRGAWAAFFLFPAIFVASSNLSGAADHFVALFVPPLFISSLRAATTGDEREAGLAGLFAGAALVTKPQSVFALGACALLVAGGLARLVWLRRRELGRWDARPALLPIAWAVGGLLVLAAPHYGKAWVFYRNPFYPFAQDVFASTPTVPRASWLFEYIFKDDKYRLHGTFRENLRDALRYSFTYSFESPYQPRFAPFLGSMFTLSLPLLPFLRDARRIVAAALVGYLTIFAWAFTFRVDRNLQIIVPLLAAVSAAVLVRAWDLGASARAGLVPLVGMQIVWGGDAPYYDGGGRLQSAISMIRAGYEGRREERFHFRRAYTQLRDALPKDARVLYHNDRTALGIDRDILSDIAGCQGLLSYEGKGGPRALYDALRAIGVTHLLHQPGHRPAPSKQTDILFTELSKRYAKFVLRAGEFELLAMPATPPPPDPSPYRVLVLGLGTYADGIYPLDRLDTYENMPTRVQTFPKPDRRVRAQDAAPALEEVEAVLVGQHGFATPELEAAAMKRFQLAKPYTGYFSIYLRR